MSASSQTRSKNSAGRKRPANTPKVPGVGKPTLSIGTYQISNALFNCVVADLNGRFSVKIEGASITIEAQYNDGEKIVSIPTPQIAFDLAKKKNKAAAPAVPFNSYDWLFKRANERRVGSQTIYEKIGLEKFSAMFTAIEKAKTQEEAISLLSRLVLKENFKEDYNIIGLLVQSNRSFRPSTETNLEGQSNDSGENPEEND